MLLDTHGCGFLYARAYWHYHYRLYPIFELLIILVQTCSRLYKRALSLLKAKYLRFIVWHLSNSPTASFYYAFFILTVLLRVGMQKHALQALILRRCTNPIGQGRRARTYISLSSNLTVLSSTAGQPQPT